jgi:hypothetical protein
MLNAMRRPAALPDASGAYPRRIADTLSARLWLAQGFPIADVLTMLEVRRRFDLSPHDCRTYAIEILSAARAEIHTTNQPQTAQREESFHAVA